MILPLENEMKKPEKFKSNFGVLNRCGLRKAFDDLIFNVIYICSYDYHCDFIRRNGTLRIFTLWLKCTWVNYFEFAEKWNVRFLRWHELIFNQIFFFFLGKRRLYRACLHSLFLSATVNNQRVTICLIVLKLYFWFEGLACYVAIDITWNEYISKRITSNKKFWE